MMSLRQINLLRIRQKVSSVESSLRVCIVDSPEAIKICHTELKCIALGEVSTLANCESKAIRSL